MPSWSEVLTEINQIAQSGNPSPLDHVRRKYLLLVHQHTGRNLIAYYSGWLQKPQNADIVINDKDKNALMVTIHKMNRNNGLDLILHTPGGDLAATESLVDYLHSMFGKNVRAIIPQISMSAGTMMAMACKEIMMGKQSNLGPIDPQIGGLPCQGVIDEFKKAIEDIKNNPSSAPLWQTIVAKYYPTFLGTCENAIKWSESLASQWLLRNMFEGQADAAERVLREFSDHNINRSHARHISKQKCVELGLKIVSMEEDQVLQDLILTVHHAYMHTFSNSGAVKIVENHHGIGVIEQLPAYNMGPQVINFGGQPLPMSMSPAGSLS